MTAREAALRAIYKIEEEGAYMTAALKEALKESGIQGADRALVTELIYGITANKAALDYIISRYSRVKIKKMSAWVLGILRMGVFQLHYMDKIPDSAVCNEAAKLAKRYSHRAGVGFVNGVLRTAAREKESFGFPKEKDAVRRLSLVYSYPEWITARLIDEIGEEKCEELYLENQRPHGVTLRVNTLKVMPGELVEILKNEGITAEISDMAENCLVVSGRIGIDSSKAYKDGLYSLQNISSMLAVEALDPKNGETVIDMCAAPGGKSLAAAERMGNKGRVISFDVFEHKIELIRNGAKRLGIDIIDARVSDGTVFREELKETADRVLADVPCSGLGVIHKKPDIKWNRREEDIKELSGIQGKILENAAEYVKKGGVLVYSTCTILREENSGRTSEFLDNHPEFEKLDERQLLTGRNGESGFYICKMMKKA